MSKKHAGSFGRDLMALLALAQMAPLNIPTEIWRARQMQLRADKVTVQLAAQSARARNA
jgi:hypothetical protein